MRPRAAGREAGSPHLPQGREERERPRVRRAMEGQSDKDVGERQRDHTG